MFRIWWRLRVEEQYAAPDGVKADEKNITYFLSMISVLEIHADIDL